MLKAIDKLGFEQAAPIQADAIPVLMQGHDVVGQSQTGSGKTAAFGIPAVEKVNPQLRATQVLILCPTRELAVQVSEEIHKLAFFKRGIHALPIYGGQSYERQFLGLKQGAHIVIGTPGRVMDHMRRSTLRLDSLKMVILDEADVMLNMGFRDDIEVILQGVPKERQTVFFSATMPRPIRDLIEKYARSPVNVRIEQKAMTVPTVEQLYYEVDRRYKIEALTRLIDIHDLKLGIIFCNTKRMVDELTDHLNAQGYSADRLHGDMNQAQRDRVMNKFRKSGLEFLVATDVAARGIDVDDVEVVFNYDLPYDGEDYVHRIGRTGRKGRKGLAFTFVSGREVFAIRHIERFTNMRIQRGRVPSHNEVEEARDDLFLGKLRTTLAGGDFRSQQHIIERLLEEGFSSTDIAAALLHHLKRGEAPPVAKAKPADEFPRAERPPQREIRERYDIRDDRSEPRRDRSFAPREDRSFAPREARVPRTSYPAKPFVSPTKPVAVRPLRPAIRSAAPTVPVSPRIATSLSRPLNAAAPVPPPTKPAPEPVEAPHGPEVHAISTMPAQPMAPATEVREPKTEPSKKTKPYIDPKKPWLAAKTKPSRATPPQQTRLHVNLGEAMGVNPIDIVNLIAGETGLPGKIVGAVDIRERHAFVDVDSDHVHAIISKLSRSSYNAWRIKAKLA